MSDKPEVRLKDHEWHVHAVVRANAKTENERAWLVCVDCEIFLDRMVLCWAITKRGTLCRTALPAANCERACWKHRS
jgi:hypothetical protein